VAVMIGIDPHKASHTAAAIDAAEVDLGQVRVRAGAEQLERLMAWAQRWPHRTWPVENAPPPRDHKRTRCDLTCARQRKPSSLASCTQPSPSGGVAPSTGSWIDIGDRLLPANR
jgi:hypothetical protein